MSFPQSPYLVKLQDLKLWQCNYDNLMKTKSDSHHPSDYETIDGLSALDSPDLTSQASPRKAPVDWDKQTLTPAKPFEQLLEEKLAKDEPVIVQGKIKKPFLRKGSGLLRYNFAPKPPSRRQIKRLTVSAPSKATSEEIIQENAENCVQNNDSDDKENQHTLTPLKVPDFSIHSKCSWLKAPDDETNRSSIVVESNDSCKIESKSIGFHSNIIGKINEFALKHFLPTSPTKYAKVAFEKDCIPTSKVDSNYMKAPDSSNATDKELQIFEALEERAENTSFSSTNSSVMRLLSSTPNKIITPRKSPIEEESSKNCNFAESRRLTQKLKEANEKSDVLSDFLHNLRKLSQDEFAVESRQNNHRFTPETSFSEEEEEKSSSNTDTRNQSPSSLYTDFENTSSETTKADAAVNTSDLEETITSQAEDRCSKCKELKQSLDKLKQEVPDIQAEKARVCDFAKDLEKKRDQLSREIEKLRKKYDKDIGDLQQELENEKKRFFREKSIFDMNMKESHNRPNKKEREELSAVKKELTEVKELLKLKDTKNGATQARLRNQIKQLEKERCELKITVDSLQKENSKLNAIQKVRRPAETKLLHEINKNLSKLTEESFKSQLNKSESCSERNATSLDDVKKGIRRKSTGDATRNPDEEVIAPRLNRKPLPNFKKRLSERRDSVNENGNSESQNEDSVNFSIERQYETTFRQSAENNAEITVNESKEGTKTTKVFPDGSKEIKYSNGSWKTVSPDGQLIILKYYNGDIKETNLSEGTVKYYFAESSTWNTEFPDGSELVEYANGQTERKYKDGKIEVKCPDGRLLTRLPDGSDEIFYPDGSKILQTTDGEKIIVFPNGQKEYHTKDHKRREYPDGTVKFIYPDGTRETRYGSGRIRIKDSNNVLIMDSHAR